jgi:hypothetical protein
VFHNGWYGYKNWGIGLAAYATYYENPRAETILHTLESEYRSRAAPALELAGDGGGWGEGYYVNYWLYDIADILAFEDHGTYLYVAGDCTGAYSPKKLDCFTRQIVFERPGTFVIFDRVVSRNPQFRKTWLLQAMTRPEKAPPGLVITNGNGRLFVQTLLPRDPEVKLDSGPNLYSYGGNAYPPRRDTGPAPECRVEVSPSKPAEADYFLHVLTATDATVETAQAATLEETEGQIRIHVGKTTIWYEKNNVGGSIEFAGRRQPFPDGIMEPHAGTQ